MPKMRATAPKAVCLAFALSLTSAINADPTGFDVKTEVQQQFNVDIFLSIGKDFFVQANGQPWQIPSNSSMRFSGTLNVSNVNDHPPVPAMIRATNFTDYHLHVGGAVVNGNFPVTLNDRASSDLEGGFLGPTGPFNFLPLSNSLPSSGFVPLNNFLTDINGDGMITDLDNIYVGVNLNQWVPSAFSGVIGSSFTVLNGRVAALPGYYFSFDPVAVDPLIGYTSDKPFTGTVYTAGITQLASVPEPSTFAMGITILVTLLCLRHRPYPSVGIRRSLRSD